MIRVPYLEGMLRPETQAWAIRHQATLCSLGDRQDAYHEQLCLWWRQPGDLVIVEQDVLPSEHVVTRMLECTHDWCAGSYDLRPGLRFGMGLGCTKFSERLRNEHPNLALLAGESYHDPEPPKVWWVLDTRLSYRLVSLGCFPHDHGEVTHLRV